MNIGETIKKIRKTAELTQTEFADAIGCRQSMITRFENGIRTPSLRLARKIVAFAKDHKIKIGLMDIFSDDE